MKSSNRQVRGTLSDEVCQSFAHFLGRFVGKGNGQYLVWRNLMFLDQLPDSLSQDTCFTTTGAGKDEQRAFPMTYGFGLLRIERIEIKHER